MKVKTFFTGLGVGLVTGMVATIVTAPQAGKQLRSTIIRNATTFKDQLIDVKNEIDSVIFGTTESFNTTQPISRTFIGNGWLLFTGNQLKFDLLVETANVTVNLEFKIYRIMCWFIL